MADTTLKLAYDVFGNELGIQIGLLDFLNLDLDLFGGQVFEALANLLDSLTLAPNDDAGLGSKDCHDNLAWIALDLDLRDARAFRFLVDEVADAEIFVQVFPVTALLGEPTRLPRTVDPQTEANRVYFSTHLLLLVFVQDNSYPGGTLDPWLVTATSTGFHTLHGDAFIGEDRLDKQIGTVQLVVVFRVGNR